MQFKPDGMFYTESSEIDEDDLLYVVLPGMDQLYLVKGVIPKYDTLGKLSHTEVQLVRETKF